MQIAGYDMLRANAPYRAAFIAATESVLDSGQLILGNRLEAFEREFSTYSGTVHCVGTGNGLDALTLSRMTRSSFLRSHLSQAGFRWSMPVRDRCRWM
jgi:dTDP-4-amino-4,6-dideoxygalactose transaminase